MKRTIERFFGHSSPSASSAQERGNNVNIDEVAPPAKKAVFYRFHKEWLKEFEWLRYEDGGMYCAHCRACGPEMAGHTAFAQKTTHFKRESMTKHALSAKHKLCRDKCVTPKNAGKIVDAFKRQHLAIQSNEFEELKIKFNTAYTIAKEEMPFTKFRPLLSLMKKNGLNLNMTYANDKSCANIIGVISETFREDVARKISSVKYLSILIDGDTDVSVKECEIVYARIILHGKPQNILVGHVELDKATADGVITATKATFNKMGSEDWLQKLVSLGADGAAVNMGKKGGVAAKLQQEVGNYIIPFHCMPHRLELALLSAQKDSPWVGNVYNLLNLIWKTYHFSSKSRRELKCLGAELGVSVNNPSGVRGTRWLPHVSRALDVLLRPGNKAETFQDAGQYTAVYTHMDHLAASSANADIAGRAKKVKETMEDALFLAFCHFLADLLTAVSKFSLLLQRNDVILPQTKEGSAMDASKAVHCFKVFNHHAWPEEMGELIDYGTAEVNYLLEFFHVVLERNGCDPTLAKEEFKALKTLVLLSFKDKSYCGLWQVLLTNEPYCSDFENILHLVRIMLVLPVSSAQCERGFSAQRRIKSDVRSSLHPTTVEDLIRISVEGPSVEAYDASAAIKKWLEDGQRERRPNFKSWPQDEDALK
uniref:HAT C-terminal dimerisation domain-containing protein n=1 Tax=Neogobius melanostomus TaxID=47308 RepID=A0A8C6SCA7_9GOBI